VRKSIRVEALVKEPQFVEKGLLLDKNQQYPIQAGWYDIQPVKKFLDRKGNPVQVVRLVPHQHQPDGCTCKVCGQSLHDYKPAGFVPRRGYDCCTVVYRCVHCGKGFEKAGDPHDWAISGHTRTCKRCGVSEEFYSSLDEYLDEHDGWARWETVVVPLRDLAAKIDSLQRSAEGSHHVWARLPDGSLYSTYSGGRVVVRQNGTALFQKKIEWCYRSGETDVWTGEGKLRTTDGYDEGTPLDSGSSYWEIAQKQIRYQLDAEYRNKVDSVRAELTRLRAAYWTAHDEAVQKVADIIQARNLYNAKSEKARLVKRLADALVLGRMLEF
jgi:DNA-directed RNA polymerase subunit RPC12/RpoP